ncbi:MAG: phosphate ABC transporter permease PstA [Syntrophorhabdus aromaticivorans]|uniref:Phosphate transport system permease protein PstA n=2 Tax=Syntrophorhabdus aromaticivorans TaxID=328301 RepID=A0A351TZL0_9BACT|nr:phosphate ABC transporter permease PstA [Syntrophorhabdus aromaticivorans]HBA53141.1 phosphate ABC transporter permease PtsA [Syntrophorhabdus aromaticivorans]
MIKDRAFRGMVVLLACFSMLPLLLILYFITRNGIAVINWEFLTQLPRPIGEDGGGVFNAVAGTAVLIALSSILSIPFGITTGIYLSEKSEGKIAHVVRLCVVVLQGTPSIVIGIVAYIWIVAPFRSFSAISGGIALSIMMLPVIIKATEETLKLMPYHLKEASLALGVPYYKTILKVILPTGISGILTGILLSLARITGETAPLLFTAFGNQFMNWNLFKPIDSLPYRIFYYAMSPYPEWHAFAWGASFILVAVVLGFNLIAKGVAAKWKVQF